MNAFGFALSDALLTSMGESDYFRSLEPKWIGLVIAAGLDSFLLALSHSLASRRTFPFGKIFLSLLMVWVLGGLSGELAEHAPWLSAILYGCLVGLAFALVEKKFIKGAWLWPCACAGGVSFLAGLLMSDFEVPIGVKGLVMGLVYGGMTCPYLLLKHRENKS